MQLFSAIEQRRAVKHYIADAAMPEEDFQHLMQMTLLSPTSYNIQHWRFVRVQDKQQRQRIKEAAWGQQQVEDAAELVILCADTQAWSDRPERYWQNADQNTQTLLVNMLGDFYRSKPQLQRDEAIRSCGMAAQTLMLTAKALGYDTCPMIGFDDKTVAEIINLPENYLIGMMITVGKAEHAANPRGGQLDLNEVLKTDRF